MVREYRKPAGMHLLIRGIILILLFGIAAMPFVGISFAFGRGNGAVTRTLGFIMLLIAAAAWGYVVFYSVG